MATDEDAADAGVASVNNAIASNASKTGASQLKTDDRLLITLNLVTRLPDPLTQRNRTAPCRRSKLNNHRGNNEARITIPAS